MTKWTRRGVLAAAGAAPFIMRSGLGFAAEEPMLEKLRKRGVLKIGIANNLPWSNLNPDGSLVGIAPTMVMAVASRLGIPKVEGIVGAYGDLIPGMNAGRWDIVGASLSISPERCLQVLFSDVIFRRKDGSYVGFLPSEVKNPPKTVEDAAARFDKIGFTAGTWAMPIWQKAQADSGRKDNNFTTFTDSNLMLEGLMTKRVQLITADGVTMQQLKKQVPGFEYSPIDLHVVERGSAAGFRKDDRDLRDAFNVEFRELKKSGMHAKILAEYGLEWDAAWMDMSGDASCAL